jgi:hypothetical protein
MQATRRTILKTAAAAIMLTAAAFQPVFATTTGVKFDDSVTVAGQELTLNGAGLRTKFFMKIYALGLYLQGPDKKTTVADILAAPGARRVQIHMLYELTSEELGKAFIAGLNDNTNAAERAKIAPQIKQFSEIFAAFPAIKKGDVLTLDWIPGSGTQCTLNGKPVGPVLPDQAFYNAILRIWIGDKPVDSSLKPQLLGEK